MEAKSLELVKLIGVEVGIFERFLRSLDRQQEALVANDFELLQQTTGELENLTLETKEAEKRRQRVVESLSQELDLRQEDVNLSKLTKLVAEPQSNQLAKLQSTLLQLHDQIMKTKSRNEFLIRKSMEYLDTTLSYLTGSTESKATYPNGDQPVRKRTQSVSLDRRA